LGAFSIKGKASLAGRQNSLHYQQTLTAHLLPFGDTEHGGNYIFQHDNASIHSSASTRQFLSDVNVRVMDWPALSPDLNPIVNLWSIIVCDVYDAGKQYDPVIELERAVKAAWDRIPLVTLVRTHDSCRRCQLTASTNCACNT
jgi:hypothetical protein